ncbi:hypothetical protein [Natrinema salifodinae]|uniref:Tat (Twin-arginine translocation) pathway signal sequence n=1 Tax=Natrinema salifodinae TaxID=1202768 RepID=A0A1I0QE72_9EURY|nr:hypothetical protein [Natrinema salifodinae]SEW25363.1 hypothetical protein SAMN05216285_3446 [Natrinema salifodinae]
MSYNDIQTSRRDVLKGLSAGASALLAASGAGTVTAVESSVPEDSPMLGDFREGLEGWKSRGPHRETRVEAGQTSVIETGGHGLQVPFTERRNARIWNQSRVRTADFAANRYLFARLTASVGGTNSPLVFFARLYYPGAQGTGRGESGGDGNDGTETGNNGNGNSKNRNGKSNGNDDDGTNGRNGSGKPVVESHPIVVPQNTVHSLYWDLEEIPEKIRSNVHRLEIVWFLADHPPAESGSGRGRGQAEYMGTVLFDHIRLSDDNREVTRKALRDKRNDLQRFHGSITDNEVLRSTDDMELGNFVFTDGEKIMYGVKYHDEAGDRESVTYILDGERFALGGEN